MSSFNFLAKYRMDLVGTPTYGLSTQSSSDGATSENLIEMALMLDCMNANSKKVVIKVEDKSGSNSKRKGNWKGQKKEKIFDVYMLKVWLDMIS